MEKDISIRSSLLKELEKQMTKPGFDAWMRELEICEIDEALHIAYLGVPDIPGRNVPQIVSVLQDRYRTLLESSLEKVMHERYRVVVKEMAEYDRMPPASKREVMKNANDVSSQNPPAPGNDLRPQYTFDAFVVGEGNRLAHAAAFAVASSPAEAYNPVYIYGPSGMGKTHLLQAIGNHIVATRPELCVLYVSAENFTNELILAIQRKATYEFKRKYRSVDVLLIDDIQFFGRTKESQEEFFHTFNDLYQANKQIVISSDCAPDELDNLQDRLKTRFQWNLIADIQPPDFETRVEILKKRAEMQGLEMDADLMEVVKLIAGSVSSNVRELEGALTRLVNFAGLLHMPITVDFAKKTLKNIFRGEAGNVTPAKIRQAVCEFYRVKESDLDSEKRQRNISDARQMAMYLMREMTDLSLPEIGKVFGGRHHTTVLHACSRIEEQMKVHPDLKKTVQSLKAQVEASA